MRRRTILADVGTYLFIYVLLKLRLREIEGLFNWGKCFWKSWLSYIFNCMAALVWMGKWLAPLEFRSGLSEEMWRRGCTGYCKQGAHHDQIMPIYPILADMVWRNVDALVFNELVENHDQKVYADKVKTSFNALQVVTESQQLISANRFFQTVHFKEPVEDCSNQFLRYSFVTPFCHDMLKWSKSKSCCHFFFYCRPIN